MEEWSTTRLRASSKKGTLDRGQTMGRPSKFLQPASHKGHTYQVTQAPKSHLFTLSVTETSQSRKTPEFGSEWSFVFYWWLQCLEGSSLFLCHWTLQKEPVRYPKINDKNSCWGFIAFNQFNPGILILDKVTNLNRNIWYPDLKFHSQILAKGKREQVLKRLVML